MKRGCSDRSRNARVGRRSPDDYEVSNTSHRQSLVFWMLIAAILLLSLWLRRAFPIFAIGFAGHDDRLFVSLAEHLRAGEWLGPYGNLTMAKGAVYSMFMALNQLIGMPLKTTEHLVYLGVSLGFSLTMGILFRNRLATLLCLTVLALNPVFWNHAVGGRVIRECLYVSLSLLLLTMAVRCFVLDRYARLETDRRAKWPALMGLGLTGGAYWLTREEGAWLFGSLLMLSGYWVARKWVEIRSGRDGFVSGLKFLAMPAIACAAVIAAVNAANLLHYGVYRNNDFRSADFQSAYGALARIKHDDRIPYVVFPADARARAYSVSAAARELKPYLEGKEVEVWHKAGCEQTGTSPCPEILAGWFMWALRDAVLFAGHYGSARDASAYYKRLAREVNDACDRWQIPCDYERNSLIPTWQPEFVNATLRAIWAIFIRLTTLDSGGASIVPSLGSEQELALFDKVTNGPLASDDHLCRGSAKGDSLFRHDGKCTVLDGFRLDLARRIEGVQASLTALALPAALLIWMALLIRSAVNRQWHPGHVVVAALTVAVAARLLLLGFLEATSMPSNNMAYLSPAIPMALALAPCVIFLGLAQSRSDRGEG